MATAAEAAAAKATAAEATAAEAAAAKAAEAVPKQRRSSCQSSSTAKAATAARTACKDSMRIYQHFISHCKDSVHVSTDIPSHIVLLQKGKKLQEQQEMLVNLLVDKV